MSEHPLRLNLHLLGFGNVGRALYQLVFELREEIIDKTGICLDIAAISDSSGTIVFRDKSYNQAYVKAKSAGISLSRFENGLLGRDSFLELSDTDAVLAIRQEFEDFWIIDTTPSDYNSNEASDRLISLFRNGIPAVTANKSALVNSFCSVSEAAKVLKSRLGHRGFGYTAATGLTWPPASKLAESVGCASVTRIEGILNGTSGYILSQMQGENTESEGAVHAYSEALDKAREKGIAESNPALDVEGWDTAAKLSILTSALFRRETVLSDVVRTGIDALSIGDIAKSLKSGKKMRLIGRSEVIDGDDGISLRVCPESIDPSHPLYGVSGTEKALIIATDLFGTITVRGGRSGTRCTASVMLNDLVECNK